jgi:hypothetical protein
VPHLEGESLADAQARRGQERIEHRFPKLTPTEGFGNDGFALGVGVRGSFLLSLVNLGQVEKRPSPPMRIEFFAFVVASAGDDCRDHEEIVAHCFWT